MIDPLRRIDGSALDALILGGGLTGCMTAWELAGRGLRSALVERRDLGWGASGRWVRLLEGGLGAVAGGHLARARMRVHERTRLMQAAPHLVRPCPVLLLSHPRIGRLGRSWLARAPRLHGWLGATRAGWPGPRAADRRTVLALSPQLRLGGDGPWPMDHDALTDGRRLAVAVAAAARASGAEVLTRCEPVAIEPGQRRGVMRVTVRDRLSGELGRVDVRVLINATGAWIDATRRWAGVDDAGGELLRAGWGEAVVLDAPTVAALRQLRPGRPERGWVAPSLDDQAILHLPARHRAGGSGHDPEGAPRELLPAGRTELRWRQHLGTPLERVRCWVPLAHRHLAGAGEAGRLVVSRVAGGTWLDVVPATSTLRWRQARRVAARVCQVLGTAGAITRRAPIPGGDVTSVAGEEASARGGGVPPGLARWLVRRHGSRWPAVWRSAQDLEPSGVEAPPLSAGEMIWSVEQEGARTLADLFWRWRLPELLPVDRRDEEWELARRYAQLAARRWSWSDARLDSEWRRWQREREESYRSAAIPEPVPE